MTIPTTQETQKSSKWYIETDMAQAEMRVLGVDMGREDSTVAGMFGREAIIRSEAMISITVDTETGIVNYTGGESEESQV